MKLPNWLSKLGLALGGLLIAVATAFAVRRTKPKPLPVPKEPYRELDRNVVQLEDSKVNEQKDVLEQKIADAAKPEPKADTVEDAITKWNEGI